MTGARPAREFELDAAWCERHPVGCPCARCTHARSGLREQLDRLTAGLGITGEDAARLLGEPHVAREQLERSRATRRRIAVKHGLEP